MKILFLIHEFPPIGGGGANACYFLSKEFIKYGHSVVIITAHYNNLPFEEVVDNGIRIIRVSCKRKYQDKSSFFEMFTFLINGWINADKLVKNEKVDYCFCFFGVPSGPIALYLKKKYGIPYSVRLGGGDIPGAQKRFRFIYKVLDPIIRSIWKNAEFRIANSKGLRERALDFEPSYPIIIIENGVDISFFTQMKKKKEQEILILFVSRLIEGKGLQDIIPLLPEIQQHVYEKIGKNIRLWIVGDGPYKEKLEKVVADSEAEKLVSFEGKKDKMEIRDYYQRADVFILPSRSEGMPNVVLEAMSSGLPIIMTPCEGSEELVTNNGIISDINMFGKNLEMLCLDEAMRLRMGKASAENADRKFQWKDVAMRYLRLLNNGE